MEADGAAGWKGVYILWVVMVRTHLHPRPLTYPSPCPAPACAPQFVIIAFVLNATPSPRCPAVAQGLGCGTAYLEYRRRLQQAAGGAKGGEGSKSLSELVDMELQGLDSSKA